MASSDRLEQQAQEKVESSEPKVSAQNSAPLFRARKRSQKARKKRSLEKEEELDEGERVSKTDLLLIREAQAMREKTRVAALDTSLTGRNKSISQKAEMENGSEHASTIGLRSNFAVERSNNVMEEHMKKYIDEGIRRKFGNEESTGGRSNSNELKEDNLYAIPEYLKLEARLQYDPGEGMPAAGVEEVELPEHVRRKNELETLRAREKLCDVPRLEGRSKDVNSSHLKSEQRCSSDCSSKQNMNSNEERPQQAAQAPAADNADGKKRRFRHATDNLVADRFRKRWRR